MFHSVSMPPPPIPESESVELVLVGWDGGVRVTVRLLRVGKPGGRRQQRRSCVQTTLSMGLAAVLWIIYYIWIQIQGVCPIWIRIQGNIIYFEKNI